MALTKTDAEILNSRPHYEILDGLRGIAAIAVVTFHFMEIVYSDYSKNFIGHGFLAVDFFFCLSGFVIAYAYDGRIKTIGVKEFFISRLIRLHPLVIFGSILGLLAFIFDPFAAVPATYNFGKIAFIFFTSVFLIPNPTVPERAFNLFGFNAPAWSLFWEYVANIVYALVLVRLPKKALLFIAIIPALWLCYIAWHSGNLMGGWGGSTFWDGSARVWYSFTAGLLIYRYQFIIKSRLGFLGIGVLLMATFLMPYSKWNWLSEPFVVLVFFPLLVALGAGASVSGVIKKLCVFCGNISYPLYMTHYAVMWMFAGYVTAYKPDTPHLVLVIIGGLILLIAFAYLVMVGYDIPVRKYLTNKRKQRLTRN